MSSPRPTHPLNILPEPPALQDAAFFKALADPTRMAMVLRLATSTGMDVEALATAFPQDRSVISRHLQALRSAGVLQRQRQGRHVVYTLNGPAVLQRLESLAALLRDAMATCCPPLPADATTPGDPPPRPARPSRHRTARTARPAR